MKTEAKRLITTPIFYCNARPHLGHAYGTILADFLARLSILRGEKAWLVTGTDEHGEKMAQTAAKLGREPREYCDEFSAYFSDAWKELGLHIDCFYRTSNPAHYKLVQTVLQHLYEKGEIYFAEYEGKYCVGCERYRKDSELTPEGLCPDHLTAPEIRKEPNYFFKVSKYQQAMIDYLKAHSSMIQPEHYFKETMGMLAEPLDDLNISRPKDRLSWGIELPFDNKFVTYVWFDALLSYLGGMGYSGTESIEQIPLWKESTHTLGKDILKTHTVYWFAMLMAMGLPPPKKLIVSGFWLVKGHKMSKSLGNVLDPMTIAKHYGRETLRYFLLSEMSFGLDASLGIDVFIAKANSDLANGLGNLSSRVLTLAHKNFDGMVPPRGKLETLDTDLLALIKGLPEKAFAEFDETRFHLGIKILIDGVKECDRYINATAPWALAKDGNKERLGTVLSVAIEVLHVLSILLDPVLPEGCARLRVALGCSGAAADHASLANLAHCPSGGAKLGEVPRLYQRLEAPKDLEA